MKSRRVLSVLTLVVFLLSIYSVFFVQQAAADENIYESEDNFMVTSAPGDDYCTIDRYTGSSTEVIVPDTIGSKKVKYIGPNAFFGLTTVHSVSLPYTVDQVMMSAFKMCNQLTADIPFEIITLNY